MSSREYLRVHEITVSAAILFFLAEQPSIKKNIAAKTLRKIISMSSESVLEKIVVEYE